MSSNRMSAQEQSTPTTDKYRPTFSQEIFRFAFGGAITSVLLTPLFVALQNAQLAHSHARSGFSPSSNKLSTNMAYTFAKRVPQILVGSAKAGAKKNTIVGERDNIEDGVKDIMGSEKTSVITSVIVPALAVQGLDTTLTSASFNKNTWTRMAALIEKQGGHFAIPQLLTGKEKFNAFKAGIGMRTAKGLPTTIGLIVQPKIAAALPDTMSKEYKKISTALILGILNAPLVSVSEILLNEQLYTVKNDGSVSSIAKILKDNKGLWNTVKGQLPPTLAWMCVIQIALQYTIPTVDDKVQEYVMPLYMKAVDIYSKEIAYTEPSSETSSEISELGESYRRVGHTFLNKPFTFIKSSKATIQERAITGPSPEAEMAREKFESGMGSGF